MKKLYFYPFLIVILGMTVAVSSCKDDEEIVPDVCEEANAHNEWGYDEFGGPECWNAVCGEAECLGDKQSPINIVNPVLATDLPALNISGHQTKTMIKNNGHTIEFEQEPGSFITYGQTTNGLFDDYTIGQFHFHAKSEHQVGGDHAQLEAHLVCRSIWRNDYIVIGVLFEEGASNPFLAQFVDHLPGKGDEPYEDAGLTYNPFDILPANRSYYTYAGSLTTPPCSEIVKWIVMENKVQATAAEIEAFTEILENNYRPVQPLNGRTIEHVVQ